MYTGLPIQSCNQYNFRSHKANSPYSIREQVERPCDPSPDCCVLKYAVSKQKDRVTAKLLSNWLEAPACHMAYIPCGSSSSPHAKCLWYSIKNLDGTAVNDDFRISVMIIYLSKTAYFASVSVTKHRVLYMLASLFILHLLPCINEILCKFIS